LLQIWFALYRRQAGGPLDSSGFEHVFVGEVRGGEISGFHNWIRFYLEEKKGTVDYRGYIKPRQAGESEADSNDHVLTINFTWNLVNKQIGTLFIGVSPEWEIA
jgi:poly(U)-specific endoribonuclease